MLPQIPVCAVPNTLTSLVDCINVSYEFEYALLKSYSDLQNALDGPHPATFNFVQQFVDIQNESVDLFIILIKNCEYARYTPASNVGINNDYENAVKVIAEIDKQI